ncbi:MAG: helix-turn-helix transcriptional regulator [Taibaiella sp.]|nr:helix-turn-helix transcriptional regulator [Taibaiella sp.]
MTTNKEKLLELVAEDDTSLLKEIESRIKNRSLLRESFSIAIKVLARLDELNWTQKELAEKLGVTPQQVNKIVKGKQNLTLESLIKLQSLLDIPLLASYNEAQTEKQTQVTAYSGTNIQPFTPAKSTGSRKMQ